MSWIARTNVALGIWLVVAAFALQHGNGDAVVEDVVAGSFVALSAIWAVRAYRPSVSSAASLTVVLGGLWVVAAPFALGYGQPRLSVVNDLVVGIAILILGLANLRLKNRRLSARHG